MEVETAASTAEEDGAESSEGEDKENDMQDEQTA